MPENPSEQLRLAYERALVLLSYRSRSEHEIRARLAERAFAGAVIDAAIERLREQRYLDDARLALDQARSRITSSAHSRRRVERDLQRRGIDSEHSRDAIAAVQSDHGLDDSAVAEQAARKKLRSLTKHAPDEQYKRLLAYLARQGHSFDAAKKAARAVLSAAAEPEDR